MPIDYKKYPPNWKTEIVPAVLKRSAHCCENCGLANRSTAYSIRLSIKGDGGRYMLRSIWFNNQADALREGKAFDVLVRPVRIVLTIAHLDHDETNHAVDLSRLRALCQICHLRYDAKEKYRRQTIKWEKPKQ